MNAEPPLKCSCGAVRLRGSSGAFGGVTHRRDAPCDAEPPSDSIRIPCEGSGAPTVGTFGSLICAMCGRSFPRSADAPKHDRDDIIAMLKRGDYG